MTKLKESSYQNKSEMKKYSVKTIQHSKIYRMITKINEFM